MKLIIIIIIKVVIGQETITFSSDAKSMTSDDMSRDQVQTTQEAICTTFNQPHEVANIEMFAMCQEAFRASTPYLWSTVHDHRATLRTFNTLNHPVLAAFSWQWGTCIAELWSEKSSCSQGCWKGLLENVFYLRMNSETQTKSTKIYREKDLKRSQKFYSSRKP